MIYIFITVVVLVISLIIYIEKQERLKRKELERKRLEAEQLRIKKEEELAELHINQKSELYPLFSKIDEFNKAFSVFIESPKFISNYDLYKFKEIHNPLSKKTNNSETSTCKVFEIIYKAVKEVFITPLSILLICEMQKIENPTGFLNL